MRGVCRWGEQHEMDALLCARERVGTEEEKKKKKRKRSDEANRGRTSTSTSMRRSANRVQLSSPGLLVGCFAGLPMGDSPITGASCCRWPVSGLFTVLLAVLGRSLVGDDPLSRALRPANTVGSHAPYKVLASYSAE